MSYLTLVALASLIKRAICKAYKRLLKLNAEHFLFIYFTNGQSHKDKGFLDPSSSKSVSNCFSLYFWAW